MGWYIAMTIISGFGALLAFVYFYRKGEFDDMEDAKYELFRNDDGN